MKKVLLGILVVCVAQELVLNGYFETKFKHLNRLFKDSKTKKKCEQMRIYPPRTYLSDKNTMVQCLCDQLDETFEFYEKKGRDIEEGVIIKRKMIIEHLLGNLLDDSKVSDDVKDKEYDMLMDLGVILLREYDDEKIF